MFFFRKLFGLFFIGLLFFGLLGVVGRGRQARYDAAYLQGFIAGQQTTTGDSKTTATGAEGVAEVTPDAFPSAQRYNCNPGFGSFLLPLLLIGAGFMFLGKRRWHGHHHPRGPWGHRARSQGAWGCSEHEQPTQKEKSPDDIDDGSTMYV
ncbi:MAG: hypothetical protein M9918_23915 [Anaerolineae bacterium]|nr:hypothetical protein [Anaerolineae bacterium]